MSTAQKTTVAIGEDELNFNISTADFNQFINEQQPNNKIQPAYNFLNRTVVNEDKEKFRKLILKDGLPNGVLVMQVAGVLAEDLGVSVEVSVKKSNSSAKESEKTATAN